MKRAIKTAVGLTLAVLLLCGSAQAAGEIHVLEGKGIEIEEPEGDYYILYRGMDPDSPALAGVGMTAQQVDEIMEADSIYLVAVAKDGSYEILVGVLEGEQYEGLTGYDMLGRQRRYKIGVDMKEELDRQGITLVGGPYWYEEGEVPYMVIETAPNEVGVWVYQYQTIYTGRAVSVTARSSLLEGPTDHIREELKRVVECVHYPYRIRWLEALATFEIPWADIAGGAAVIAIAGAVLAGQRKKRKKNEDTPDIENRESTGGDDL